jgi:hypothetical protein
MLGIVTVGSMSRRSQLRPADVDNLKALIEFEDRPEASCQPELKKLKSIPLTGSLG